MKYRLPYQVRIGLDSNNNNNCKQFGILLFYQSFLPWRRQKQFFNKSSSSPVSQLKEEGADLFIKKAFIKKVFSVVPASARWVLSTFSSHVPLSSKQHCRLTSATSTIFSTVKKLGDAGNRTRGNCVRKQVCVPCCPQLVKMLSDVYSPSMFGTFIKIRFG